MIKFSKVKEVRCPDCGGKLKVSGISAVCCGTKTMFLKSSDDSWEGWKNHTTNSENFKVTDVSVIVYLEMLING